MQKFRYVVTFNECRDHEKYFKEVPNDLALFSSLVLKKKKCIQFDSEAILKKYSYTNSSQKVLFIVLLENTIYIDVNFFSRIINGRKCILCTDEHFLSYLLSPSFVFTKACVLKYTKKADMLNMVVIQYYLVADSSLSPV